VTRTARWTTRLAVFAIILALLAVVGFHFALQKLKSEVESALGSNSSVGQITVGWNAIELTDLRIRAPEGWPAPETLRATLVRVRPDLRSLLQGNIHIAAINVEGAYLSVWRTHGGKMRLLPSLLEDKPEADEKPAGAPSTHTAPTVQIDKISFTDSELNFVDDSVPRRVAVDLAHLQIDIDSLLLPALSSETTFQMTGEVSGHREPGHIDLHGVATLANHDSDVKLALRDVDLVPLAPYLLKAADSGVRQGTLDLSIDSSVKRNHLHAPGEITLHDLSLDAHGTFMGASQNVALGILKNRQGTISAKFVLEGNLDDPHFSLNENLLKRTGAGLADSLGVSVGDLTRNVGSAAEGVGSKLKNLFHH
jgi:hypothetical protein